MVRFQILLLAALALLAPWAARADGVTFGFSGGLVNAGAALPHLTNDPANGGTQATLNLILRTPNPPGPLFGGPGFDFGSVTFTTGNAFMGTPSAVFFLPGGSVTISSNANFQNITGLAAGTTLFSGTFSGVTSWTQLTCMSGPLSCGPIDYILSGQVSGTFDPAFLAFLNLTGVTPSFTFNITMSFPNALAAMGTAANGTAAPVPEPGTLLLVGSGVAGMLGLRQRKTTSP